MKIPNYNNWKLWTQTLLDWLENQFAAVASSIDFTTVNNKIDAVGSNVTDFRHALMGQGTAVSLIDPLTCLLGFTDTPPASPDVAANGIIFGHESGENVEYSFGQSEIQEAVTIRPCEVGEKYDYPFGVRVGMEIMYGGFGAYYWYVPTQAPDFEDFYLNGVLNIGETGFSVIEVTQTPCNFTCLKRVDYYDMGSNTVVKIDAGSTIPIGGTYIGSVFVFKAGMDETELNLGDIRNEIENIELDTTDLAKQGTNPNATNTAILAAFGNIDFSTLAKQGSNADATLTAVLEALQGGDDPDIPEGVAERLAMILEHFGIKTISGYSFGTPTEIIDELKDIMGAIDQEATLPNSVTIDGTTYSGTSNS